MTSERLSFRQENPLRRIVRPAVQIAALPAVVLALLAGSIALDGYMDIDLSDPIHQFNSVHTFARAGHAILPEPARLIEQMGRDFRRLRHKNPIAQQTP